METAQKIVNARIAVEDMIKDLERVTDMANAVLIHQPARQIYAESAELFHLMEVLAQTSLMASTAKAELLRGIGMSPNTRLRPFPTVMRV